MASERQNARFTTTSDYRTATVRRRPANLIEGCIDIVARLTDTAERTVNTAIDSDPRYGATRSGDVVRQAPDTICRTAMALNDGLVDLGATLVNCLDLRTWERWFGFGASNTDRTRPVVERAVAEPVSESALVNESRSYISRGPNPGATLDGLVRHLRPLAPLSDVELHAFVTRNFLVDGDLVFPPDDAGLAAAAGLPDSVEAHLRALGYEDLRRDVPLERAGSDAPCARMVAYKDGTPTILVFRTSTGGLGDALVDEDARFQAKALSRVAAPGFVYITDGVANRYISLDEDRVIAQLPRAKPLKTSSPAASA
jgi:hypothetical protein